MAQRTACSDNVDRESSFLRIYSNDLDLTDGSFTMKCIPVLFCSYTSTGDLKEAVWAVIPTYFDRHASITSDSVALFTKI